MHAFVTTCALLLAGAASAGCPPADPAGTLPTAGPYAAFRTLGELVFVSGQIGVDPRAPDAAPDFETQMRAALARVEGVLEAAGSDAGQMLKVTVYLADPADAAAMNRIYAAFFAERNAPLPARSLVPGLDFGNAIEVEIDVIARRRCGAEGGGG